MEGIEVVNIDYKELILKMELVIREIKLGFILLVWDCLYLECYVEEISFILFKLL